MASQDWDTLLYGSPVMVRNLTSHGTRRFGRVMRAERISLSDTLSDHGITREQLVDLGIMVGTDFHPGIKGIGPKTGLKLMKKHGTMEAVSEAKGFDLPEDLESVRGLFMDHPLGDSAPTATSRAVEEDMREFLQEGGDSQRRGSTEPSTAWLTLGGLGPRVSPRCSTSDQMTSKSFSSVSGMPSPSSSSSV